MDRFRWTAAAAVLLISTLMVGACTAADPVPQAAAAQPTPLIVYVTPAPTPKIVYATPEPTAKPTAKPTPKPTPEPTPEPVLLVDERWMNFLGKQMSIESTCTMDDWTDAIGYAADDYGVMAYREGLALERCVQGEIDWLNANRPSACYKPVWLKIHGYYSEFLKGIKLWDQWLYDFPYGTDGTFEKGSAHITEAISMLSEANILMGRMNDAEETCMTPAAGYSG